MRIEDYAVIGDTQTIALVGANGSIDWLCFPRFDGRACFAALLGTPEHGRWLLAPRGEVKRTRRCYRDDTMVLETELETADGVVRLVDYMPIRGKAPDVVRIVEGVRGVVPMRLELIVRYDYGGVVPWVHRDKGRRLFVAGPDALVLSTPVAVQGHNMTTIANFSVGPGDRVPFTLTWYESFHAPPESPDPFVSLRDTEAWWHHWSRQCQATGPYRDAMIRSLVTLKGLTYAPSGGIVAAGTTALPEAIGGVRNWDYRYCWLRDATFTLQAMLHAGYRKEASAWRDWLVRAVAGDPAAMQIMYAVDGTRRLDERALEWLPGYEGSRPVRIGNAAVRQRQLDIYGEVIDMLYLARNTGLQGEQESWAIERGLLDWLESNWKDPDEGMWEVRGCRQQFTYSKVMVWAAFDRAAKTVERFGTEGPIDRWRALRDEVHADICAHGFDPSRGSFTQAYGSKLLDASLLLMPVVGFLPIDDPRMTGTIRAIERELVVDGFVRRYPTGEGTNLDGMQGRDGAFIACSFWLVDALVLANRRDEARRLFERILDIRNDVGLLSEEYDPEARRLVGNFPQAFSHVALVNSARNLYEVMRPADERSK